MVLNCLQLIPVKQNADLSKAILEVPVIIGNLPLVCTLSRFNPLPGCESFNNSVLPISKPFQG